jgi:RNA polymerase-associated protein RTF1
VSDKLLVQSRSFIYYCSGKHTQRGATKTKTDKLAELKAKRRAKDERKKVIDMTLRCGLSFHCLQSGKDKVSPKRHGSVSSNNMEISSEEEDGEINKDEQLEERVRNTFDKAEPEERIEMTDVQSLLLTRDKLVNYYLRPWFEEYVKGTFTISPSAPLLNIG